MAMLRVANCPSQDLALTNAAFVNAADAAFVPYAELGDLVLFCKPHDDVEKGTIALNGVQRKLLRVSTGDTLRVEPFTLPSSQFSAAAMTVELEFTKLRTAADLNAAGRHEQVRRAPFFDARDLRGKGAAPPAFSQPRLSRPPRPPRVDRERGASSVMNTPLPSWNYHLKPERLGLWSPALWALLRTGFPDSNAPSLSRFVFERTSHPTAGARGGGGGSGASASIHLRLSPSTQ